MNSHTSRFEILVIGEFSGRDFADDAIHTKKPIEIGVDTFDDRFAQLQPTIEVPLGRDRIRLEFDEFEALHPDSLMRDPAIRRWLDPQPEAPTTAPMTGPMTAPTTEPTTAASVAEDGDDRSPFARLMGDAGAGSPGPRGRDPIRDAVDDLARRVVKPAAPPQAGDDRPWRALRLEEILDAPSFRSLEGRWLGLRRLVSRTPDEPELRIAFVDISNDELATGFKAGGVTNRADLPSFLGSGAHDWSVIVLANELQPTSEDLGLLAALGILGSIAHAPVIAGYHPRFVGIEEWSELPSSEPREPEGQPGEIWRALRTGPIAPWIGLVGPRILARVPYGKKSDPAELPIEEATHTWSPASLGCAELLATSFAERGWAMGASDSLDLEELPMAMSCENERISPCETWISERAAQRVGRLGFMVLQGDRQRDRARLLGFHSIGDPATRLAGRWEVR